PWCHEGSIERYSAASSSERPNLVVRVCPAPPFPISFASRSTSLQRGSSSAISKTRMRSLLSGRSTPTARNCSEKRAPIANLWKISISGLRRVERILRPLSQRLPQLLRRARVQEMQQHPRFPPRTLVRSQGPFSRGQGLTNQGKAIDGCGLKSA